MSKIVRKFEFSDLRLAFKVRDNMWEALVQFDANQNLLFEEDQIAQAMITILGEDQHEVHYVVKNVFRYDRDGDGAVTYTQFTNFSVEQHFGEMAIQRLHRKGYYTNGARRIMNLQQFENTLNYCLEFIGSKGTHAEYEKLFSEVDLDKDGFISYQDYFIFLREYFGSQSKAFQEQILHPRPPPNFSPKKPQPKPQPPKQEVKPQVPKIQWRDGNGESPQQRFAKLIYSQFKITVMERDRNKNLLLQRNQVDDILSSTLRLGYSQQSQLADKIMGGGNTAKYEDFLRASVIAYMSDMGLKKNFTGSSMNQSEFVDFANRLCQFVTIKPADHVLKACFKDAARGGSSLSQSDVSSMMRNIFQNFRFDTRGLPSTRPKSQRFDAIAPNKFY